MAGFLPSDLKAALAALTEGVSRREIGRRALAISENYRAGGGSQAIRDGDDALAYAFVRMPATYAAVGAALSALAERRPDFAPQSLLDVGAGPGTAAWAAAQTFPDLADISLIDCNGVLRALAQRLLAQSSSPALRAARYDLADMATGEAADLVIASYVIGERPAGEIDKIADSLWARAADTLVVVEPGTPAGFARVIALRARLIGRGAHVVAPCPHDDACPIQPPDWCHFSQRLARSRDHRQVKDVALPFEDEKFAYAVLAREPAPRGFARVLAPPRVTKASISVKLCTRAGLATETTERRERELYKQRGKWLWGDAVPD